jgi:hypothetical protein
MPLSKTLTPRIGFPRKLLHFGTGTRSISPGSEEFDMAKTMADQARAGAEYIVSSDSSCLMHQQGCAERIGVPIKFIQIAEILNGASE